MKRSGLPAALVVLVVFGQQVGTVALLGDELSPVADPFSEANAIRSGEGYAAHGFVRHAGLPMPGYGDRFPEVGFGPRGTAVYTHYPPGPDLLVGLLTNAFGEGRIALYRIAPLGVGLLSLAAFAALLSRAFAPLVAAAILAGCAAAPMFGNMMHGLHYQGYAFSLLLVELGLALRLFGPRAVARPARHLAALGALGFLQGWLSFDYCFLVTFAPLPLALLWEEPPRRERIRRAALAILSVGSGFVLAHGLHFLQVAAYHGGMGPALSDLAASAQMRAGVPALEDRLILLWQYATVHAPSPTFLSWTLPLAWIAFLAFWIVNRGAIEAFEPLRARVAWHVPRGRSAAAVAAALGVSFAWVALMWEHAADHVHFLPRHAFLLYFVCLLVPVAGSVGRGGRARADPAAWRTSSHQ